MNASVPDGISEETLVRFQGRLLTNPTSTLRRPEGPLPRNFPDVHQAPQIGDTFLLMHQTSNTNGETGIALMHNALCIGWITKGSQEDLLHAHSSIVRFA